MTTNTTIATRTGSHISTFSSNAQTALNLALQLPANPSPMDSTVDIRALQQLNTAQNQRTFQTEALSKFKATIQKAAADPAKFHSIMSTAFGTGSDKQATEALRSKVLSGDFQWLPSIKVLSASDLPAGANGAYDKTSNTVYLNESLAQDPALATKVLSEEIGHHIDTLVNKNDAKGDEGDLFSRLLGGEKLTQSQISTLKNEKDDGVITVDGKKVNVEFSFFGSIGKFFKKVGKGIGKVVGGAAKGVAKAAGWVAKGASKVVGGAVKGIGKAAGWVAKGIGKVGKFVGGTVLNTLKNVGGSILGTVKNLFTGNFSGALKSILGVAGTVAPFLLGPIGGALGGVLGIGSKVAGTLFGAGGGIVNGLAGLASKGLSGLTSLLGGGSNILGSLFGGGASGLGGLLGGASKSLGNLIPGLSSLLAGGSGTGSSLLGNIANAIPGLSQITGLASSALSGPLGFVQNLVNLFGQKAPEGQLVPTGIHQNSESEVGQSQIQALLSAILSLFSKGTA